MKKGVDIGGKSGIMTFVDPTRGHTEWYRRGHNEHDWKSCDGQKPSEGSNPSHSAKPRTFYVRGFLFSIFAFRVPRTSWIPWAEATAPPLFLPFCLRPRRLLTGKSLLYIFVCKTHKNGENTQKFGYHAWIDLKEVEMFGQNDGAKGLQKG